MKVIGIDPGYDRLGVAVLDNESGSDVLLHSACIETPREKTLPERLVLLGDTFGALLTQYEPDSVGIETLFFNQNQKTAIGVAQARGTLIYLAMQAGCAVYELGPQEVKVAVTGYGKSDKQAVYAMVKRLVPNVPEDALDDEYDAIAVGVTALAHHGRGR